MTLFLAPVYVPLKLLGGWVHTVATVNPATAFLEAGRGLVSGAPTRTLLAFALAGALVLAFVAWALRGLRSAESTA
jgi:ABC-2 type transport system permease protein